MEDGILQKRRECGSNRRTPERCARPRCLDKKVRKIKILIEYLCLLSHIKKMTYESRPTFRVFTVYSHKHLQFIPEKSNGRQGMYSRMDRAPKPRRAPQWTSPSILYFSVTNHRYLDLWVRATNMVVGWRT